MNNLFFYIFLFMIILLALSEVLSVSDPENKKISHILEIVLISLCTLFMIFVFFNIIKYT